MDHAFQKRCIPKRKPAFCNAVGCTRRTQTKVAVDLNRHIRNARANGHQRVAGADEAGAGCLAGPLVCAAVMLRSGHPELTIAGLGDSKRLSAAKRSSVYEALMRDERVAICTAILSAREIDEMNILEARKKGLALAVDALEPPPHFVFVDGNFTLAQSSVQQAHQRALIGADATVSVVAAAGIIAKCTRDAIVMSELHSRFPAYAFDRHKGYATKLHIEALKRLGPTDEHRFSYRPVREARDARERAAHDAI